MTDSPAAAAPVPGVFQSPTVRCPDLKQSGYSSRRVAVSSVKYNERHSRVSCMRHDRDRKIRVCKKIFDFFKVFEVFSMLFCVKNNGLTLVFFLTCVIIYPKGIFGGTFSLFSLFRRGPETQIFVAFSKYSGGFLCFSA